MLGPRAAWRPTFANMYAQRQGCTFSSRSSLRPALFLKQDTIGWVVVLRNPFSTEDNSRLISRPVVRCTIHCWLVSHVIARTICLGSRPLRDDRPFSIDIGKMVCKAIQHRLASKCSVLAAITTNLKPLKILVIIFFIDGI